MSWRALVVSRVLLFLGLFTFAVAGVTICLWWLFGGNVAGWLSTFVLGGALIFLDELFELGERFSRGSKRLRSIVMVGTVVLAAAGSAVYVLWPGTTIWYLASLPAVPVILVFMWLQDDENPEAGAADLGDGPWTAR